jgi:hypothetical protein
VGEEVGVAGGVVDLDDFRKGEQPFSGALGCGLAHRERHERDEAVAEGGGVDAPAEGLERAVGGQPPQPGMDGVPGDTQRLGQGEDRGVRVVVQGEDDPGVQRVDAGHGEHSDT